MKAVGAHSNNSVVYFYWLLLVKLSFTIVMLIYFSKTSFGDYGSYLGGGYQNVRGDFSTHYIQLLLTAICNVFFGSYAVVFILSAILSSFLCYSIIKRVAMIDAKLAGFALFFVLEPFFIIMTSLPSKELVILVCQARIFFAMLDKLTGSSYAIRFTECLALLVYVYIKPIYIIFLLFSYFLLFIYQSRGVIPPVRLNDPLQAVIICGSVFLSAVLFFYFYPHFSHKVLVSVHYRLGLISQGGTTINQHILPGPLLYLYWALSYPFLSLIGFTQSTAVNAVMLIDTLYGVVGGIIWFSLLRQRAKHVSWLLIIASLAALYSIFLMQLPYGIWNIGSAVRYRSNSMVISLFWLLAPLIEPRLPIQPRSSRESNKGAESTMADDKAVLSDTAVPF